MLNHTQNPSSSSLFGASRLSSLRASLRGLAGAFALATAFLPGAAFSVPASSTPPGYTLSTYKAGLSHQVFNLTMDQTTGDIYYDSSSPTVYRIAALDGQESTLGSFTGFNPFVATDITFAGGALYLTAGSSVSQVLATGEAGTMFATLEGPFGGECGGAVIGTTLYATAGAGGGGVLAKVDLLTGAATTLDGLPMGLSSLEYNSVDGFLYAAQLGFGDAGTFYKINPTTGVATALPQPTTGAFNYSFSPGSSGDGDFAIQPDGKFFFFRSGATIYQYDPLTGNTVDFVTGLANVGFADDMTFGPSSATVGWSLYFADGTEIKELAGFSGPFSGIAVDDAVTSTNGATRVYPLANDIGYPSTAMITSIAEATGVTIAADGRSLLIPAGFAGTFTYATNQGTSASIVVLAGTPAASPRRFSGLLYSSTGAIGGWSTLSVTPRGVVTGQLMVGSGKGKIMFSMKLTDATGGGATALGAFTVVRNADGTLGATLTALDGDLTGALRPSALTATAGQQHIALASVHSAFGGGGYAWAIVNKSGSANVSGVLPDGRPFTSGGYVSDNGTIAFYAAESNQVLPAGMVGGELVSADLAATDVTGEIAWSKPAQGVGAKGNYLGGVNTVLTANGSLYSGAIPMNGPGTLRLSGGNLAAEESNSVVMAAGVPAVPTGVLKAWAGVKLNQGQFRVKVQVPGIAKPVAGGGVYLSKTNSAWGYFPGTTDGGRIELTSAPLK